MENIFKEETKEEVIEEFKKQIQSKDFCYIPEYFNYSIVEIQHKRLIEVIKSLGHNMDYIFLKDCKNREDLVNKIKNWLKINKISIDGEKKLINDDELNEETKYILKKYNSSGSSLNIKRQNINGELVNLILYGFANTKFNTYVALFHELGHILEEDYLDPRKNNTKTPIEIFLYRFQEEVTTNMFSYSILYLMLLQQTQDKNILENAKNCIIKSAFLNGRCSDGYFDVPIVIENIDKITTENYIDKNNKIDFLKLYDFCFTIVQAKAKQYEKILLDVNADKDYINNIFNYKILTKLETKNNKNVLENDLYMQYSIYKKLIEEKSPLLLKNALKFTLNFINFKHLEKTLKYLQTEQFNYTQIEKSIIKFNKIINKYEYYTKQILQLVKKQGNSKIYFFVKTDYLDGDKINDNKLNQDLNGLEFQNLKQNILKHFNKSKGQNLSYYHTDDTGKIHFTDFIVLADYNNLNIVFHELCHSLQHSFNNSRKPINMNNKQEFLHYYNTETQADLFSFLLLMLDKINDKYNINFDKILFESAERNGLYGYFSFPILKELIEGEIKTDPQKFLNKFKTENKINLEKLFNFVIEKVQVKRQIYAEFILNKNIDFDILIEYFCAKKIEKEKFPDIYKHSKLEEDLRNNEIYKKEYQNKLLLTCSDNFSLSSNFQNNI